MNKYKQDTKDEKRGKKNPPVATRHPKKVSNF